MWIALGPGVLGVETPAQAEARAARDGHDKGAEAAVASLKQSAARRRLGGAT